MVIIAKIKATSLFYDCYFGCLEKRGFDASYISDADVTFLLLYGVFRNQDKIKGIINETALAGDYVF